MGRGKRYLFDLCRFGRHGTTYLPKVGMGELLVTCLTIVVETWWVSRRSAGLWEHVPWISSFASCPLGEEIKFGQGRG